MADSARLSGPEALIELTREAVLLLAKGDAASHAPRIVAANAAFGRLFGAAPETLLGDGLRILRGRGTERARFAQLVQACEDHAPIEVSLVIARADGTSVRAEARGRPVVAEDARYGHLYAVVIEDIGARRDVEGALRHVAEHFQALSELTSDYVYALRVEPDCRLVLEWAAGAFTRITGYTAAELDALGGWLELVDPEDLDVLARRNQRLIAGEPASAEYRIVTKSGEHRWLEDSGRAQRDEESGLIVRVVCAAIDVTDRRRARLRREAERRDRAMLAELIEGVVCRLDGEGRIREVMGSGPESLMLRLRAGLGGAFAELIGGERAWHIEQQLDRVMPGGDAVRFETRAAIGGIDELVQIRLSAADSDTMLAVLRPSPTVVEPVTTSFAPGLAEAPAEFDMGGLLDAVDSLVLRISPEQEIRDVNAATERITGWRREDLLGRRFGDVLITRAERRHLQRDLETVRRGGRVEERGGSIRLRDGTRRRILWSIAPLADAQGRIIDLIVSGQGLVAAIEAEQGVRDGQQRLNAIMDHVADGIVTIDADGIVESFSRSAELIFDWRREEVLGRNIDLLVISNPSSEVGILARLQAASRQPHEIQEMLGRRRSGEAIPIELAVKELDLDGQMLLILTVRDITLRKQTEETIRNLAYHDPLTGLPNRLLFHDRLVQAVERAQRNRQTLAVMLLDLDRFKLINDSLGLEKGDQVLRVVAERMVAEVRRSDTVARLGGDEFLLLLPGTEGAEVAAKVAQKLLDCLKPMVAVNSHELNVTASIGIALYPHDGEDAEALIKNADSALYRAKEQGRNVYQFYTNDMNAAAFERLVLETQLRKSLERGELVLYYQPQLDLASGQVVGVEALVRWFHPDLGMIPPSDFIPLAEETGLILAISEWVLRTACIQVQRWHRLGFEHLRLAVNLSARQFQQADLVPTVARLVEETGFRPDLLELELTESIVMRHAEDTVERLRALDALGIRLAIDDFGTGYSSLSYLKRFPIRSLKIDRSFIQDITTDPNDAAIAQAIIALAASLNLKVIAEGVESPDQLEQLRRYGCDEMQGFLFSRPLPADEMLTLLRDGRRLP